MTEEELINDLVPGDSQLYRSTSNHVLLYFARWYLRRIAIKNAKDHNLVTAVVIIVTMGKQVIIAIQVVRPASAHIPSSIIPGSLYLNDKRDMVLQLPERLEQILVV